MSYCQRLIKKSTNHTAQRTPRVFAGLLLCLTYILLFFVYFGMDNALEKADPWGAEARDEQDKTSLPTPLGHLPRQQTP